MKTNEIISLIITILGLVSFATLFTYLYRSFAKNAIMDIKSGKRDIELINAIVDEEKEKKKRKRAGIIKSVLFYLALIIIIPVFIMSMINRINGTVTSVGGKSLIVVASGSMSYKNEDNSFVNDPNLQANYNMDNQFSKFDIIVIKKVDSPSEIKPYDVIAFRSRDGKNVIHRVVNILDTDSSNPTYVTQGDALPGEDGLRPQFEDVIGVYTSKRVRGLGAIILFCQSYAGIITILSLIYCLTMLEHVNSKISKEEEGRVNELKKVLSYTSGSEPINAVFYEEIHYNGYAYRFNDNGFVDKRKLDLPVVDETVEREKKDD